MQRRGWYVLGVLCVLAGALIYFRKSPEKLAPTQASVKSRHEPDRKALPVAPAQPESRASAPASGGSNGDQSSTAGVGVQANPPGSVLERIRDSLVTNPELAESLVLREREEYPDNPETDELDALLVAAIFNQHEIGRARAEARRYLQRHPGGRYAEYLMRETHTHPPSPPAQN